MAIFRLFQSFKDGHTAYQLPAAYTLFQTIQPFQLTSRVAGSTQKLYIKADFSLVCASIHCSPSHTNTSFNTLILTSFPSHQGLHDALFGSSLSQYIGWEVVKIAGTDAMTYFLDYTHNKEPLAKDPSVNFNNGLQASFHSHSPGTLPSEDTLTFVLKDPKDHSEQSVTVRYMVFLFGANGIDVTPSILASFNNQGPGPVCLVCLSPSNSLIKRCTEHDLGAESR